MPSNTGKKLASKIARGLLIRAGIGFLTGGVGLIAWEALEAAELIANVPELFEAGADFLTLTEEVESVVDGTDLLGNIDTPGEGSTITDSGVEVPVEDPPNPVGDASNPLNPLFLLNPGVLAATFSLAKVDFYLEKLDVNLSQKAQEKIEERLNTDDVKNIRELNFRIKSEKEPEAIKQLKKEVSENISHILGDDRLRNSLTSLSLAALFSVHALAVNDLIDSSPDLISSFGDGRDDRVEEITQELQKSKHYQEFAKELNTQLIDRVQNGANQAILDEIDQQQAAEIARLQELLQAQGINPNNLPEGKS